MSDIQAEIIRLLADGLQTKEISLAINRRIPTVESHIRTLFDKMQSRSRAQLVAKALAFGIIDFPTVSAADGDSIRPTDI